MMEETNDKPSILVMMSTYNGEKYIREQIDSIMHQKVEADITLRIRDDGSQDDTCLEIEKLMTAYPGKIELIKGENKGYNASFFELINMASGYEFYSISDQDDVWLEDKLQVAIDKLSNANLSMPLLYASTSFLVEDNLLPYGTTRKREREFSIYNTIIQNICPGHTQVLNEALLKLIQGNVDAKRIYVYDSWICNIAMLYGKIVFDNDSHTYYRQHRANQLGYGKGWRGQLLTSMKHADSGDGTKYRNQVAYFLEKNQNELMKQGYYKEIYRFVNSNNIIKKVRYVLTGKLFRQKKMETIAFYIAVILGKF